jgi:hypothetical protein
MIGRVLRVNLSVGKRKSIRKPKSEMSQKEFSGLIGIAKFLNCGGSIQMTHLAVEEDISIVAISHGIILD